MSGGQKTINLDKMRDKISLMQEEAARLKISAKGQPLSPGAARRLPTKPLDFGSGFGPTATPPPKRPSNLGQVKFVPKHTRTKSLPTASLLAVVNPSTGSMCSPDGTAVLTPDGRPSLGSSASFGSTSSLDQQIDEHKRIARHLVVGGVRYPANLDDLESQGDIGRGTSGLVTRMRHRPTDKVMAVKVLQRSSNEGEQKRVLMDLSVMISHDCPYIVESYGAVITSEDVYICMELMDTCLEKVLKRYRQPLPETVVGKVAVAVVKALDYLKEKHGVIHRDVKPSNILLDAKKGCFKICDFGISGRLVDSKARTRGAGCAAYMAPERIIPETSGGYDIRADVWSMGITLVELATGVFPYQNCTSEFEVLARILDDPPPRLPADGHFSMDFISFIGQCLTKEYTRRPRFRDLKLHSFIQRSEQMPVDVCGWFRQLSSPPTASSKHG